MNYPLHELIDRLSILQIRMEEEVDKNPAALELYCDELTKDMPEEFADDLERIKSINRSIWMLEAGIRNGQGGPLEEVGARTLAIRDLNRQRCAIKSEIAKTVEEFYPT